MEKVDLRVMKTKKAIYAAFIKVMKEKGFDSLRVQDILDEAFINRKTFYKYYEDKYDLAEKIGNEFIEKFDVYVDEKIHRNGNKAYQDTSIGEIYDQMNKLSDDVEVILGISTSRLNVRSKIMERLQALYETIARQIAVDGDIELQAKMFSSFVLTSYEYMLKEGNFEFKDAGIKLFKEYQNVYTVLKITASKLIP